MYSNTFKVLIATLVLSVTIATLRFDDIKNSSRYYLSTNQTSESRNFAIYSANYNDTLHEKYKDQNITLIGKLELLDIEFEQTENSKNKVSPYVEEHLERTSIIFGLSRVSNESHVSEKCYKNLQYLRRGILHRQPWAMKMLDASGSKPSGFIYGQNYWLGSREACSAVHSPVAITLSKNFQRIMHYELITEHAPFDTDYRVVYLRHRSPWQVEIKLMSEQIIHIGLCMPSACTADDLQNLTADYVDRAPLVENQIYDIRPEYVYMKDLKLSESFYERFTFKMMITLTIFTSVMIFVALILRMQPTNAAEVAPVATKVENNINNESSEKQYQNNELENYNIYRTVHDFIKCYDISTNCERVFAIRSNVAAEIPVINGLRSVCAIWIMVFHVVWYMYFTVNNKTFLLSYAEHVFFQYVSSAPLLVDVFFTISGFLQTFKFMKNVKQMECIRRNNFSQNAKAFFHILFHRYLRIAPLYLVVMGVVDIFYAYIGDTSVYHINERFDEMCSAYWWRNIFFVQNFFNHKDMCLNWTWSLACEMQYFILATLLLFIYTKHPKIVKAITLSLLTATISWTYIIGFRTQFQLSFDSAFDTGTDVYTSPYVRIMPYILGAITAWYFAQKQCQFDISDLREKCYWNLAILIFFSCIYSTIKRDMSVTAATSLFVIGRFLFSLSVCWMIVGSATGRGSWWSRILEAKIFQHVNRLSYAIYLLNPFVIAFFFSLTQSSTHADPFMLCVLTSGFAVIVYLLSIVFSLCFEMPYCNWSSSILRRTKLKSK